LVYRNAQIGPLIDIGMLAETLLFYGNVHLLLNRGTLSSLVTELGADGMDRLLDIPEIRISYMTQNFATLGSTTGGLRSYGFGIFEVGGMKKKRLSKHEELEQIIERTLGSSKASKKQIKRLVSGMSFPRVEDDMPADKLTEAARADLVDETFVRAAIGQCLSSLLPNYTLPRDWHFRCFTLNDGSFAVDTNLDFASLNAEYHKTIPSSHSSITPDYLINFIYDAHAGTFLASRYGAEFVLDPLCSAIIKLRYLSLLRRRERSVSEIDLFQDLHLDGRNISGALKAKERSFEEFLELLGRARKFKEWLRSTNPDAKLVKEYFEAVTRQTWVDRLPTKGMRWVITTGLAAVVEAFYPTGAAIAAAQGLSLADATVLDRIVKGWKPDQFVKGPMSEFLTAG
jgi:hypothetical protein